MKKLSKSLLALFVATVMLSSVFTAVFTANAATLVYSKSSNSGKRGEVCTTLDGTSAASYYTGSYSYDTLASLSSSALFSSLQTLMRSTHTKTTTYNDCRDMVWKVDCEENDTSHATTLYTGYEMTSSNWSAGGWACNREHVWPQSLGGGNTSGGGADLHHIRPDEQSTNSTRGNKKYGNVSSGKSAVGNLSGDVGGIYSGDYFEPNDDVKGDVARICLYMYVRWNSSWGASNITSVFQSISVLLEWCALDPVDTWEMGRNEVVASIQGNRNVFIDYPELAFKLFNESAPSDMVTPSGNKAPTVTTTAKPAATTAPTVTTTAPTVTTTAPTVTEKPNEPAVPTVAPLKSSAVSLYPKLAKNSDTDSLALIYVIEKSLAERYTQSTYQKLTLTVVFYLGNTPNSYRYELSATEGALLLTDSLTALGATYTADQSCLLFGKTFGDLPHGGVTKVETILSAQDGVTLSKFTLHLS